MVYPDFQLVEKIFMTTVLTHDQSATLDQLGRATCKASSQRNGPLTLIQIQSTRK